jgi:hypothetical protein
MIRSIALGLLAGCVTVIVLAMTSAPRARPVLAISEHAVRVSTMDTQDVQTRIYRFDDLIIAVANNDIAIQKQLVTRFNTGVSPRPESESLDAICDLIESTVDPETWKGNGGEYGSMTELGGLLIVTNKPESLDRIETLFNDLRKRAREVDQNEPK